MKTGILFFPLCADGESGACWKSCVHTSASADGTHFALRRRYVPIHQLHQRGVDGSISCLLLHVVRHFIAAVRFSFCFAATTACAVLCFVWRRGRERQHGRGWSTVLPLHHFVVVFDDVVDRAPAFCTARRLAASLCVLARAEFDTVCCIVRARIPPVRVGDCGGIFSIPTLKLFDDFNSLLDDVHLGDLFAQIGVLEAAGWSGMRKRSGRKGKLWKTDLDQISSDEVSRVVHLSCDFEKFEGDFERVLLHGRKHGWIHQQPN